MIGLILILSIVGFLMIFAEVYLPGGIIGSLGGIALLGAVAIAYSQFGFGAGSILLVVFLVLGVGILTTGFYLLPKTRAGKTLMHSIAIQGSGLQEAGALVGATGKAVTFLRPTGTALIDGKRLDVLAQTGRINPGTEIRVVATEGSKIVVRSV